MSSLTLCLDGIILASGAYPSGFSYSLFSFWREAPREGSSAFLGFMFLPYLAVCSTVWMLRPDLIPLHGTTATLILAAVLIAPAVLAIEYLIHGTSLYLASGAFPARFTVHQFWRRRLSLGDHALLAISVVGEELIYRSIWFSVLHDSFGLPLALAVAVGSLAYGLNHLSFGGVTVLSKTVSGLVYASLYLFGGQSIILPMVTHVLQNIILFGLARKSHA